MRRLSSTVVVVAGEQAGKVVAGLDGLRNVRAITRDGRSPAEVDQAVNQAVATYVVHDADPLGAVGDAWAGLFDGAAPVGALEVATETALAALRSERVVLPDYYVVLDPGEMPVTRRHWWLGVLAGAAPARVVPAGASASAVTEVLGRLSPGRWWPADVEGWLRELPRVVPDQAGLPSKPTA
ncbi:hypothetical protein GCM10027176_74060 [Actinoallomurus bryophytorum]|uniref:Uncharacterized protein n=1 Tax=Actinoallomurus bryophytorum TaxID=1490222 RepID=A0A543C1X2_9ACTN|nr:hypothetical protein [Actinoallomurus bryophytorum]TQL91058.1 hypothetical protein FB559_8381 [Actinoallomurus bryophytorum]